MCTVLLDFLNAEVNRSMHGSYITWQELKQDSIGIQTMLTKQTFYVNLF